MIPSPKVPTYDLEPEMSAEGITEAIIDKIKKDQPDFVCLNYANTDMVGHTGVFQAAIKAAETVDNCLEQLMNIALPLGYGAIVIADHGNSDKMINEDGTPHTAHTTNLVPCFFLAENTTSISLDNGKLGDIAPTLLYLMGIPIPKEMTGNILLQLKR